MSFLAVPVPALAFSRDVRTGVFFVCCAWTFADPVVDDSSMASFMSDHRWDGFIDSG